MKKNTEISKDRIIYLKEMMKQIVKAIEDFEIDNAFGEYIYADKNRAKFDRLRLELQDELLKIKKEMYKET